MTKTTVIHEMETNKVSTRTGQFIMFIEFAGHTREKGTEAFAEGKPLN